MINCTNMQQLSCCNRISHGSK